MKSEPEFLKYSYEDMGKALEWLDGNKTVNVSVDGECWLGVDRYGEVYDLYIGILMKAYENRNQMK